MVILLFKNIKDKNIFIFICLLVLIPMNSNYLLCVAFVKMINLVWHHTRGHHRGGIILFKYFFIMAFITKLITLIPTTFGGSGGCVTIFFVCFNSLMRYCMWVCVSVYMGVCICEYFCVCVCVCGFNVIKHNSLSVVQCLFKQKQPL